MAETRLPFDAASWRKQAQREGVFEQGHSRMPKMASASKVEYKDWLHLRILWKVSEEAYPTHEALFGHKSKDASIDDLERTSTEFIQSLPWYAALTARRENPVEWHALAHWRESVNALARRTTIMNSPHTEGLRETYSGEDLFKLRIEPVRHLRSHVSSRYAKPDSDQAPKSSQESASRGSDRESIGSSQADSQEISSSASYNSHDNSQGISLSASYEGSIAAFMHGRPPGEEDVNYSFLALLSGLSMYDDVTSGRVRWSPRREEFSIGHEKSDIITARTDGCLKYLKSNVLEEDCPTLAIVEAKARRRNEKTHRAIQIQEGAEMAAWISCQSTSGLLPAWIDGSGTYRRVLLSQDFDEVYVIVASYPQAYLDWITGRGQYRKSSPQSPTVAGAPEGHSTPEYYPASDTEMTDMSSSPLHVSTIRQTFSGSRPQTPSNQGHVTSPRTPVKRETGAQGTETGDIFLTMHQYKAFRVTERSHMESFMVLLVSLVRKLCHEYDRSHIQQP